MRNLDFDAWCTIVQFLDTNDIFVVRQVSRLFRDALHKKKDELIPPSAVLSSIARLEYVSRLPEHLQPRWLSSLNCYTTAVMAEYGNLEVLEWAKQRRLPMGVSTCDAAARSGRIPILRWLREHDIPWNWEICHSASRGGHLNLLKWARKNGCDWCPILCRVFACDDVLRNAQDRNLKRQAILEYIDKEAPTIHTLF